jgi:error-prone DNA polymerase
VQLPAYAELHCLSNFSFLRGASHPEELVRRAVELGYTALAVTDECSLAGVVRAHAAARGTALKFIVGSEFTLSDGFRLVLLARDRESYGALSRLITHARMEGSKGQYRLTRGDLESHLPAGCIALWLPARNATVDDAAWLRELFGVRVRIAVELLLTGRDTEWLAFCRDLSDRSGLPPVAAGDVHMHSRGRRALQDTLTAIRLKKPLHGLGHALYPNGERHLRPRSILAKLYPPALLAETVRISDEIHFSLDELRYEYPAEIVPAGHTPASWLRVLTEEGARSRWPAGAPDHVTRLIGHELALIAELRYEAYFLTVHDIVRHARQQGILCQGRGSAANSAVCFCLGITEVDPARMNMLMERFISKERNEPPDIDVDFEHERREEVIQYIYGKYGRRRAALAAAVITYRLKSAVRDVGKVLGMSLDQIDRLARQLQWWDRIESLDERLLSAGFDPENPKIRQLIVLAALLNGFPRHLSQHTGGFVIASDDLAALVPVENAAMADRTVIQWDKDDLESLGLIKVDVLALGMLTAIRKAFRYIEESSGRKFTLADVPAEDTATYDMICRADTVGVFQIESRAQMSMLPRLKPRCFFDLVIEVAIVRPGPIQGDMVHPYLERRRYPERVEYPSAALKKVLERTLGVPIFQEQAMQIAMVAAGFTAGEADQLRRAMAAWKKRGGLEPFEEKLKAGMRRNGYDAAFAERVYSQLRGFGEYGFPESHAASFALLTYVSSWLKCHEPAAFACGLLNSQPMGFYAPAQLVQDAARHGVEVRPVDVRCSRWDCTLEATKEEKKGTDLFSAQACPTGDMKNGEKIDLSPFSLRLGMRLVKGLKQEAAERIAAQRERAPFSCLEDMVERCALDRADVGALAAADALHGLAGNRYRAHWAAAGIEKPLPVFDGLRFNEAAPLLERPGAMEEVIDDYRSTGLSLRRHPVSFVRERLDAQGVSCAIDLEKMGKRGSDPVGAGADPLFSVKVAGLVICRQRPDTASGVLFMTLEDETGTINLIVWPQVVEKQRRPLLSGRFILVHGTLQREDGVLHVIVKRAQDRSDWLSSIAVHSRNFTEGIRVMRQVPVTD